MSQPEKPAFAEIYEQNADRIYAYLVCRVPDRATAEDLTADVFAKAYQRYSQFDLRKGSITTWLYAIARHRLVDHFRSDRSGVGLEYAEGLPGDDNLFENQVGKDRALTVRAWLADLSEPQRELVILRVWDELPFADIAAVLGKSEASLKMAFSRLMRQARLDLVGLLLLIIVFLTTRR